MLKCNHCPKRFTRIDTLGSHMRSSHPASVSASIRSGLAKSNKTPQRRATAFEGCIREIAALAAAITPVIVARDPSMALSAISNILKVIDECAPLLSKK